MPAFQTVDVILFTLVPMVAIGAMSLLKEPARRNFNAIFVGGAGAAYLSGGFLPWEVVFTAVMTWVSYKGLQSYRYVGIAWLLHVAWDVVHHVYGNPIVPLLPMSSAGCAITDTILACWCFAGAPSAVDLVMAPRVRARGARA